MAVGWQAQGGFQVLVLIALDGQRELGEHHAMTENQGAGSPELFFLFRIEEPLEMEPDPPMKQSSMRSSLDRQDL